MFSTDPSELRLVPEVRRLRGGEPAALAGVRPETSPLLQLGSELVTVRHIVPATTTGRGETLISYRGYDLSVADRFPHFSFQKINLTMCTEG